MIRFLLWNTNQKPLEKTVANIARLYDIDVVVLVESAVPPGRMIHALTTQGGASYRRPFSLSERTVAYTRFTESLMPAVHETKDRLVIWHLKLPACTDILLAAVHLPSKMYFRDESQRDECFELSRTIRDEERRLGLERTVLVGDFNMNPFETGVVSAAGLNATSDATGRGEAIADGSRTRVSVLLQPDVGIVGGSSN